jgi:hypothetical protein
MGNTKSVIIKFNSDIRHNARAEWLRSTCKDFLSSRAEEDWEKWLKLHGGEMINRVVFAVADIQFNNSADAVAFMLKFS